MCGKEQGKATKSSMDPSKKWEDLIKNAKAMKALKLANNIALGNNVKFPTKINKMDLQEALVILHLSMLDPNLSIPEKEDETEGTDKDDEDDETEQDEDEKSEPSPEDKSSGSTSPPAPAVQAATVAPPASSAPPKPVSRTEASQATQVTVPNCRFHKWKECKDKAKCKYKHPTLCGKYLWYGPVEHNAEHGCNKKECNLYHPPLCYGSLKFRECRTRGCKRRHLPQTKFTAKEAKVPTKEVTKKQVKKPNTGANKPRHQQSRFSREPTPRPAEPEGIRSVPSSTQVTQGPPPTAASFLGPEAQSQLMQRLSQIERLLLMRQPVMSHPVIPQGVQFSY